MLREITNKHQHYFRDEKGLYQGEFKTWRKDGTLWAHGIYVDGKVHGEYKRWWANGERSEHSFYRNDKHHGEYKSWHENGQLQYHCFFVNGTEVSFDEIPYPTTPEERMLFVLKYDLQLLP